MADLQSSKKFNETFQPAVEEILNTFGQDAKSRSTRRVVHEIKKGDKVLWSNASLGGIEVPSTWSDRAAGIAAEKYNYKGRTAKAGPESSVYDMVDRVLLDLYAEGTQPFVGVREAIRALCLEQVFAFNTPVWLNFGVGPKYGLRQANPRGFKVFKYDSGNPSMPNLTYTKVDNVCTYAHPQGSACFILDRDDTMKSLFHGVHEESNLFQGGSGVGSNFSKIRSRYENVRGGSDVQAENDSRYSSGLMAFLKLYDCSAGVTKSGGISRRAAKMVCLDLDHPEVMDFITWKSKEEIKAQALIAAGYDSNFNGEAYSTVSGQNSNNSLRATDSFMQHVERGDWNHEFLLTGPNDGKTHGEHTIREMWDAICNAAWFCGDPGMQFDDTINKWHTTPAPYGRIRASNPCSEYMSNDDTACNLGSINLLKFLKREPDGRLWFDYVLFGKVVKVCTLALERVVQVSSYPTAEVAKRVEELRQVGLGYANLGGLLMAMGIPYGSPSAQLMTEAITATMCARSYEASAAMADLWGPFTHWEANKGVMSGVIEAHASLALESSQIGSGHWDRSGTSHMGSYKRESALRALQEASIVLNRVSSLPMRNAQTTVLAPTGTIGFIMDCHSTGIEPVFAHVAEKHLAGGGSMSVDTLGPLGLAMTQLIGVEKFQGLQNTMARLGETLSISRAVDLGYLSNSDAEIFACVLPDGPKCPTVSVDDHLNIMAAAQKYLSGAISKTVNLPENTTPEEIGEVYLKAWKLGLKAVAVYRDNCKLSQPLNAPKAKVAEEAVIPPNMAQAVLGGIDAAVTRDQTVLTTVIERPLPRIEVPTVRETVRGYNVTVGGTRVYMNVTLLNGAPVELFINASKVGSTLAGFLDVFGRLVSLLLQHHVPLETIAHSLTFLDFEPQGVIAGHPRVKMASSIPDAIFRVLGVDFAGMEELAHVAKEELTTESPTVEYEQKIAVPSRRPPSGVMPLRSGDMCDKCGGLMQRTGTCQTCAKCGLSSGGCG